MAGSARVTGLFYNNKIYDPAPYSIHSYIDYIYTVKASLSIVGGGAICTFVTFTSFSSWTCTYLLIARNPLGGNSTAIITIFPSSPPSALMTQLQTTDINYTDTNYNVLGIGYSTTSNTLTISIYTKGLGTGYPQTVYFTMKLLSGA